MNKIVFILNLCVLFLTSCSPKIYTNISQQRTPLVNNAEIKILQNFEKLPPSATKLGTVRAADSGFTVDCDYETVIEKLKAEARKAGGNLMQITEHKEPNFASTCHRITADVYSFDQNTENPIFADNNEQKADSVNLIEKLVIESKFRIYDNITGVKLTNGGIRSKLIDYPEALKTFNNGVSTRNGGAVVGWLGGFCIGWGIGAILGSAIAGGEVKPYNYYIMGAGGVMIIPALIIDASGKKKIKKAVNMYNSAQDSKSNLSQKVKINFGLTSNGTGLIVNF